MDVIHRLITESKRLAVDEEEQREQVFLLKSELMVQEQNIISAQSELKNLKLRRENVQLSVDALNRQLELMHMFRDTTKDYILQHSYLKALVLEMDPSDSKLAEKLESHQSKYQQMVEKYESLPSYRAILEEEATERDLAGIIIDMRNQLMRLETEQEF